jgi:hypothetical protein
MGQTQDPQWAPPPAQPSAPQTQDPQWAPPPTQTTGWGGGGMAPVERPAGVTLGSIYLIVMGILMALGGAACGLIGGAFMGGAVQDPSGLAGMLAAVGVVAGIIVLVLGILQIAAGAGALGGKGWARWTGVILSVIFAILTILSGVSGLGQQDGMVGGIVSIVIGVLYALTAWAFIQASAYFAARR